MRVQRLALARAAIRAEGDLGAELEGFLHVPLELKQIAGGEGRKLEAHGSAPWQGVSAGKRMGRTVHRDGEDGLCVHPGRSLPEEDQPPEPDVHRQQAEAQQHPP